MSPELMSRLYWTYQALFRLHLAPVPGTPATFGGDHGDGWFVLLDALCQVLSNRSDALRRPWPDVIQIIEEAGGLWVELRDCDDDYSIGAIKMTERVSHKICELSGRPGRRYKQGTRFRTLSREVAPGEGYERMGQLGIWTADDVVPYPPLSRPEVAEFLKGQWGPYLTDDNPDIPGGWLHIADALLEEISVSKRCACTEDGFIEQLRDSPTGLVVRAVTGSLEHRGAIALATALAKRTDRNSGCLGQEI